MNSCLRLGTIVENIIRKVTKQHFLKISAQSKLLLTRQVDEFVISLKLKMDLEVCKKIFVYIILIIMDFLNRYPYDSHHHNETATLRIH